MVSSADGVVFPQIIETAWKDASKDGCDWVIFHYVEFEEVIFDEEGRLDSEIKESLKSFLGDEFNTNFRIQLDLRSIPCLVGFFYDTREIRLYSPRLSRELFLLSEIEIQGGVGACEDNGYSALKSHVEKVSSLHVGDFPTQIELLTKQYNLPDLLNDPKYSSLDDDNQEKLSQLIDHMSSYRTRSKEKLADLIIRLTARFPLFRKYIFHFLNLVSVVPFDRKGVAVKRLLEEHLRNLLADASKVKEKKSNTGILPSAPEVLLLKVILFVVSVLPSFLVVLGARHAARRLACRFIVSQWGRAIRRNVLKVQATGRDVILDQLEESVITEKEADQYRDKVIDLIKEHAQWAGKGAINRAGIKKAQVAIKMSALVADFKPYAHEYLLERAGRRLKDVLLVAQEHRVLILLDAEQYDYRDAAFKVLKSVLLESGELKEFSDVGVTIQAYHRDAIHFFRKVASLAKKRELIIPVRLVKGAYLHEEKRLASSEGRNSFTFLNKEETDIHFRQLMIKVLEEFKHLRLMIGSHNPADHTYAECLREQLFKDAPPIEHQCLFKLFESLSLGMVQNGWLVRSYLPVGTYTTGVRYLERRIQDGHTHQLVDKIRKDRFDFVFNGSPAASYTEKKSNGVMEGDITSNNLTARFFNWSFGPLLDVGDLLSEKVIGNSYQNSFAVTGDWHEVKNPSKPLQVVGKIQLAEKDDISRAVSKLVDGYASGIWPKSTPLFRASVLLKVASLICVRKNQFVELIVLEAGKTMSEALYEVESAIDLLNFHAREEIRINRENPKLLSRGVLAVIAPWNYPLSISCGMISAAIVAGNTVVYSSSEQTPLIGQKLTDIFYEAGISTDILIHLPGERDVVRRYLPHAKDLAGVVFTGSNSSGLRMANLFGKKVVNNPLFNIRYPANSVISMGGKNAIVVSANANQDKAIRCIVESAFSNAGQKNSAASRVIVDNIIKDRFVEKLSEACTDAVVGSAMNPATTLNPIIGKREYDRLQDVAEKAILEAKNFGGRLIVDCIKKDYPELCVGPTIIELPHDRTQSSDSCIKEELFGPILHVVGFDSLEEAVEIHNDTEYALCAGVHSQSQEEIDYLLEHLEAGTLFVNRSLIKQRVLLEPTGGFKLSGSGHRAGGFGYLDALHLNVPHAILFEDLPEERGSDYRFNLCRPSKLGYKGRLERVDKALKNIILQFEVLFQGITRNNKDIVGDFKNWLKSELPKYRLQKLVNRHVPGQDSFYNWKMNQEQVLVVGFTERPSFVTFMQFLSAVAIGAGVTIVVRHQKAYEWWKKIHDIFLQAGISKLNLDLFFSTDEFLLRALKSPFLSTIVIDGSLERIEKSLPHVFNETYLEKRLRTVLTAYDSPAADDFKKLLNHFAWPRYFVIAKDEAEQ